MRLLFFERFLQWEFFDGKIVFCIDFHTFLLYHYAKVFCLKIKQKICKSIFLFQGGKNHGREKIGD